MNNLAEHFNMSDEEFDKKMNEFVNEMIQKENNRLVTMYEQRETLLPIVVEHMKAHGSIDDEDMAYFPKKYPFTSQQFHDLFETMTTFIDDQCGNGIDEECDFPNKSFYFQYKDIILEFFIMYGQGTCTILKLVDEEEKDEIPKKLIWHFEQWIQHIEKEYEKLKTEEKA